jgi:hypothetical protein
MCKMVSGLTKKELLFSSTSLEIVIKGWKDKSSHLMSFYYCFKVLNSPSRIH